MRYLHLHFTNEENGIQSLNDFKLKLGLLVYEHIESWLFLQMEI